MWFCDAEHIIAVVITDHWACFKEVPGEQFAQTFAEAVYSGEADRVCVQEMVYTIHSFHSHTDRAVFSFPTQNYFYNYFKEIRGKCSGKCITSTNVFLKENTLVQACHPSSSCSSFAVC